MNVQLANNAVSGFTFRFNHKEGGRAYFDLCIAIGIELAVLAFWRYSSIGLGSIVRYFLLQHDITFGMALCWAIIIVLGVAMATLWPLLFYKKDGKAMLMCLTDFFDQFFMDFLFHKKFFFPSASFLTFQTFEPSFQTHIPSFPDMPPRHHLA